MTPYANTGLLNEAPSKTVDVSTGIRPPASFTPKPWLQTTAPSLTRAMDRPGIIASRIKRGIDRSRAAIVDAGDRRGPSDLTERSAISV